MTLRCLRGEIKLIFLEKLAVNLGELVTYKDSKGGDKESVDKESE